ncbi:type II toxin-antitoxin system RelE/ParE family toxin [bacterium]|nr:type II toxin-antitoxin system RelE/ParE family toxin [FCB group bacterium]MBL7192036.1 type II toxin-antitoxin system RelE/ParE family toxin [bacterium]
MYDIYIEHSAEKDLIRLSKTVYYRIIKKINSLTDNPRPKGCGKITGSKNDWRIRIGNYRVIYEINDKEESLNIMRVKHRKEAYQL